MKDETFQYPESRQVGVTDDYHGTTVADPWRWLEDMESPEVKAWVSAQNALAEPYLEAIPERQAIIERLTALWNYERYSVPFKEGGRYFYRRNDGLQNHAVLYVTDAPDAQARVLLDPNSFSEDGTIALSSAATDLSRPTNRGTIICGKTTMSRRGRTG